MKKLIFLFALVFAFTFNVKAQDLAYADENELAINITHSDYTNEAPLERISHTRGTLLVDMRSIVEAASEGSIAIVGGYETKSTFVGIAHGKRGTKIERKVFLYYFNKNKEILGKKEISQSERLTIIKKLKTL